MVFSGPGSWSGSPASSRNHSASAAGGSAGPPKALGEMRNDSSISGNISDNWRADDSSQRDGEFAPDLDGHAVFRISRTEIGHRTTIAQPVVPVKGYRPCSPLLLESVGPAGGARAPEIEVLKPLATGEFECRTVQQHVRRQAIIAVIRGGPRNLQRIPEAVQETRGHGSRVQVDHTDASLGWERLHDRF